MKKLNILLLLILCSCANHEKEWEIIKDFNKIGLRVQHNKEINPGTENCVFLYFDNNKYHIKQAYSDCSLMSIKSIDKKKNKIGECTQRLFIKEDTIMFCLEPLQKQGLFTFPSITVLFTDNNGNYFIADTTLTCKIAGQ